MTQQKNILLTPRVLREIYWIRHPKFKLLLTGALPCIGYTVIVYLIIGHFADAYGFHGGARIEFYRVFEIAFAPGLVWFLWQWAKDL